MIHRSLFAAVLAAGLLLTALVEISPAVAQTPPARSAADSDKLERQLLDSTGGHGRTARKAGTGRLRQFGTTNDHPATRARGVGAGASPEAGARGFLKTYGSLFGIDDEAAQLATERVRGADRGRSSVRFQQRHRGVPVLGGELMVNLDKDRNVLSANGETSPDLGVDTSPAITAADARTQAVAAVAKQHQLGAGALVASDPQLWVYDPELLGAPGARGARLVWRMDVASEATDVNELVLVDAATGGISLHFDQVEHAKVRHVCDRNNVVGAAETCTPPYARDEGGAPTGVADVDKAYDYSGATYDYYSANFGRDSVDGAGLPLSSTVRFCNTTDPCPFQNAFWNGSQMVYGDGFASADDVVAHELTHGVTQNESNLLYYYQSGAINESLSDVFGELVDLTDGLGNDSAGVRWLLGEDLPIGAIRSMADPPAFGDPDSVFSANYYSGQADSGGVHTNSGVNNKAAYLMVDGGTFRGVTISGLGVTKVGQIYYEAQANLLTSAADYMDLYEVLQQACLNKVGTFGITTADCNQVKSAVTVTQMNQNPFGPTPVEAPICDSGDVPTDLFFDDMENTASGNWSVATADPPGWGYATGYATSGTISLYAQDPPETTDTIVARTADLAVPAGKTTYLHFNHALDTEWNFDGGVVEYSTDAGSTWVDAGPLFVDNGYDSTLNGGSALGGRGAFTGTSRGYYSSRVELSSLAGSNVRFRFRAASDSSVGGGLGWVIDDLRVYTCGEPAPQLAINDVTVAEGQSGTTTAAFNVTRSGSTADTSTVSYATASGTAVAGSDFTAVAPTTLTFAPGETAKTVGVSVTGDVMAEGNETFSVNLSSPGGASVADAQGVGTIANDDTGPAISVNNVTVNEGNSGTTLATLTITRSGDLSGTSSVSWATAASTASAATDFVNVPLTPVSFAAGETTKTASVTVNGDTLTEADEVFLVNLSAPSGGVITDSQGVATIANDDAGQPANLSINDVTLNEGDSGTTAATFTVTRTGTTANAVSVHYATAPGTAVAGSDYTTVPASVLVFSPGQTSKTVVVNVTGDTVDEANETFYVVLSSPVAAGISDAVGVANIVDDDGPVTPGPSTFLAINDVTVPEASSGLANATFTIARSGVTTGTSSVKYRTLGGTASAGTDFVSVPFTTVNFAAGETAKAVAVQVYGDTVPEANETFTVQLAAPIGAVVSDNAGLGVIDDDDAGPPATLAVNDVGLGEGNSGTASAVFTVTRSGSTAEPVSVNYSTVAGTATAGSDFSAPSPATLSFAAGETTKTIVVPVISDSSVEANETFTVKVSAPVGAVVADDTGLATIFNDDAPPILGISDVAVTEGNVGNRNAIFTVTRGGDTSGSSTVQWATADGTATAGPDYLAVAPTLLSFAAGETAKTFSVSVKGDSVAEPNETVLVNLSLPTGATLGDSQGVVTIRNDD